MGNCFWCYFRQLFISLNEMSLSCSTTRTLLQNAVLGWWGGFRPWWYSPGFNRYCLHYVQFTRVKSKPFIFAQNVSVCECKISLNQVALFTFNTVFSMKRFLESILIWSGFLCQNQENYGRLVMNGNSAEFWNLFLLQVNVTRYFYLFVTNGNLTLLFFTHEWLQLKLANQWLLFPRSE
jgi:hypothetical protein